MTHDSYLGFGLGLRSKHYSYIFEHKPAVDWFEVISENFMDTDGKPKRNLEKIRRDYPVVMHGVSLSIGTVDPLNSQYLKQLKDLIVWLEPAWISDHLCWTGVAHKNTHDLLPVPYTQEALTHIVERIQRVQDFLGRPMAFENPSTYLEFQTSTIKEEEFLARMVEASGCQLLLDVNNVYVSCYNHGWDPKSYLDSLPLDRVLQIHLSGHTNKGSHIIDTHDHHVIPEVFNLYQYVVKKAGRIPNTMIEWDDQIPEFPALWAELDLAKNAAKEASEPRLVTFQKDRTSSSCEALPLRSLQERMQTSILEGTKERQDLNTWIVPKDNFSVQSQLNIYINGYGWRLCDVVSEDYEVLENYLGTAPFNALIKDFVQQTPSTSFNIGRYGSALPSFVAKTLATDLFAQDLATLETAISQIADLPETRPLSPHDVASLSPEAFLVTKLFPRDALQLFHFRTNVNDYYHAFVTKGELPSPALEDAYFAVYRHDDEMWRLKLETHEYTLLTKLFAGLSLDEAFEALPREFPSQTLGKWFAKWISNGLLSSKLDCAHPLSKGAA